jgi:hypothetical protein
MGRIRVKKELTLEAPQIEVKPSKIMLGWMKWQYEEIDFDRPQRIAVSGIIESGKSTWLECYGENMLARGHNVFDVFGSPVSENLAWLRSPWIVNHKLSILLIQGSAEVSFNGPKYPIKHYRDVTLSDLENTRIVLSVAGFYNTRQEEIEADKKLLQLFERRNGFTKLIYVLCREAKYIMPSRLQLLGDVKSTKKSGLDLVTQSGHFGISLGLDAQRQISVDKEARDLYSFTVCRSLGMMTVQLDDWVFGYVRPEWVQKMKPGQFLILSSTGNLGIGLTEYPRWHKERRENILRVFGFSVKYHDEPKRERKKKDSETEDPEN